MTRHLLRLVWNRKRQNLLLSFEILLSFLVLFGVVLMATGYTYNWLRPVGFDIDRLWNIQVGYPPPDRRGSEEQITAERAKLFQRFEELLATLENLPNVERAAAAWPSAPYVSSTWSTGLGLEGRNASVMTIATVATDDFREVVGLTLIAGRWFSRDDDAAAWAPVVINERLAREIFGNRDPINQFIPHSEEYMKEARLDTRRRVVGVVEDFRHQGEFSPPGNFTFFRMRLSDRRAHAAASAPTASLPSLLVIRVAPGTTAAFEQTLVEELQAIAPAWSFDVQPAVVMREDALDQYTTPLLAVGTVAAFLLLMVALGLTGVVWQSVTRRIQEFGLRRANGATIQSVRHQILAELALLTSLALLVGVALVAQLPALPLEQNRLFQVPPAPVWIFSIAMSAAVIYLLTLLCAWYPSRLATKIQPADALHYE